MKVFLVLKLSPFHLLKRGYMYLFLKLLLKTMFNATKTLVHTCVYILACLMIDSVLVSELEFCCPVLSARRCRTHLQKVQRDFYSVLDHIWPFLYAVVIIIMCIRKCSNFFPLLKKSCEYFFLKYL